MGVDLFGAFLGYSAGLISFYLIGRGLDFFRSLDAKWETKALTRPANYDEEVPLRKAA